MNTQNDQLRERINRILRLPEHELNIFWDSLCFESVKKGERYLQEGMICNKVGLVSQGVFYSYYSKEGKEIIEGFCFEGCYIADYPSFTSGIPVKKNFKAIEDSQLLTISKNKLDELYAADPLFERAGRLIAEYLFANWELKLRETIFLTPTERYENLMSKQNQILQRVPQYLIASFLNITPQYLSQIRSSLIS